MPAVLNLNNEVVRLRAEVKRVRVLIIRKLIRQISVLEKKKGSQEDLERHRRRAARLLEEIQELKVIVPDKVTKTALQKDISFENVCKNKEASMSDRAIARIATHPQFNKKIQSLKDAIKAFKDERINEINSEKQAKKKADDIHDQPQEDNDDEGPEKIDDEEKKLNEEEGDEIMDKPHEDSSDEEVLLKMRREVKSIRVLILGKLTHKMGVLKKKKGAESEVKKNQEMVELLMKDIQALRSLKPDQPTMTALKQNVELETVLQDPKASPMDRVIAHIVTHSRFINKLQKVMNTIEEKRAKAAGAEQMKTERDKNDGMTCMEEEDDGEEDKDDDAEEEDDSEENKDDDDQEEDDNEEKDDDKVGEEKLSSLSIEIHKPAESTDSDAIKLPPIKTITTPEKSRATKVKSPDATASKCSPKKSSTVSNTESELPMKTDKETENTLMTKAPSQKEDEESDLSDDDEGKEYFDDSTEERFRKQSSQSEESDDDDFFLSKVSIFKKRKSSKPKVHGKETESQTSDTLQNVAKATRKPQATNLGKLGSVFCSTLSKSSSQKHGSRHDGPRPPRFQNQKGHEGRMKPSLYKHLGTDRRAAPFKPNKQMFTHAGKRQDGPPGAGRGRSQFEQHQNHNPRGPSGKISNPLQQSLHPSWEASRKRKEQQAQIPAFQGKKIRFDDDD